VLALAIVACRQETRGEEVRWRETYRERPGYAGAVKLGIVVVLNEDGTFVLTEASMLRLRLVGTYLAKGNEITLRAVDSGAPGPPARGRREGDSIFFTGDYKGLVLDCTGPPSQQATAVQDLALCAWVAGDDGIFAIWS
jgi:hypothetical protein